MRTLSSIYRERENCSRKNDRDMTLRNGLFTAEYAETTEKTHLRHPEQHQAIPSEATDLGFCCCYSQAKKTQLPHCVRDDKAETPRRSRRTRR